MCYLETETALHFLFDCEALAETQFHHLGRHFLKQGDYREILLNKIQCSIAGTGLLLDQ